MSKCERCGAETDITTCSYFNTESICMDCNLKERNHPLYKAAKDTELAAVKVGDYNFPGIGLPDDLRGGERHGEE